MTQIGRALLLLLLTAGPAPVWAQVAESAPEVPAGVFAGAREREVLELQIRLDQARFSPGVVDGLMGGNTRRAVEAFQRARGLQVNGDTTAVLEALRRENGDGEAALFRRHTLTEDDVSGPFLGEPPGGMKSMAKLDRVAYVNVAEKLGEGFHTTPRLLEALNPDRDYRAGQTLLVPNVGDDHMGRPVARIEVDKTREEVRAFAEGGELLARYPATVGSSELPSPSGSTEVRAVALEAAYYLNPSELSFGPDERLVIPPGPNNPVGGVWIDLGKEGYGIHGTPEPASISKTASHGCVRLTNWDARELANAVSKGVPVEFVG